MTKQDNIVNGPWDNGYVQVPEGYINVELASWLVAGTFWISLIVGFVIGFKWGAGL